ncbi:outer membrane protein assembly factor BamE [Neisseria animalis]|uniref:Outer membrane protein assembly factor BamE n=1 Tax=Neisseria animalis TaxID=492 RepID=A0A5P3MTU9_NEIAN|nr:outer membrane protein assembly factor BamE [Neisseria animalis]QEY24958.1 outer membrane protein assembly factor BamE [Neisseria animalis]ROW32918.1 outer membrane protein assembly factor BamE [Neisseria animalis]
MNKTLCLALAVLLGVSACTAERVSLFPSYKLKVIQGNELDPRAVVSLQPGVSRDQVQLLLGTPLLRDAFHADRWDYTFNTGRNGILNGQSNLTVYFKDDALIKAEGDAVQKSIDALQNGQYYSISSDTKPSAKTSLWQRIFPRDSKTSD